MTKCLLLTVAFNLNVKSSEQGRYVAVVVMVVCQAYGAGGKEDLWKRTSNQINLTDALRLFKVNLTWKQIKISAIATMLYRKPERAVRKESGGLWVIKGSPCKI